ncbi:hypothetical protein T439DRAFT_49234 [Meredithblackwellia eburnea MCA 4105]
MRTSTATIILSIAALAQAQLPASAPACVTSCFSIKITEATALAPGATSIPGYCASANFVQAFANCLTDNCASSADIATGIALGQQVCASSGAAIATTGLTGAVTGYVASLSSIPISSVAGAGATTTAASGASASTTAAAAGSSSAAAGGASGSASSVASSARASASSVASSAASAASSHASSAASGASGAAASGSSSKAASASGSAASASASAKSGASQIAVSGVLAFLAAAVAAI